MSPKGPTSVDVWTRSAVAPALTSLTNAWDDCTVYKHALLPLQQTRGKKSPLTVTAVTIGSSVCFVLIFKISPKSFFSSNLSKRVSGLWSGTWLSYGSGDPALNRYRDKRLEVMSGLGGIFINPLWHRDWNEPARQLVDDCDWLSGRNCLLVLLKNGSLGAAGTWVLHPNTSALNSESSLKY